MAKRPKRPTRDEYLLEELGEKLIDAKEESQEVILKVWAKGDIRGIIVAMDARTKMVHVEQSSGIAKVPFLDIMQVERA